MDFASFLMWSGGVAWAWLIWRAYQLHLALWQRLRWALFGPRVPISRSGRLRP